MTQALWTRAELAKLWDCTADDVAKAATKAGITFFRRRTPNRREFVYDDQKGVIKLKLHTPDEERERW